MESSRTGIVMDVDHFATHDGPGIRTCIYLKGCPLSCVWCHSPESQRGKPQVMLAETRCAHCGACVKACPLGLHEVQADRHYFNRELCTACARCVDVCPARALVLSGKQMTVDEVVHEVLSDKVFYENSGGGVTLTGGEVLFQVAFARNILTQLRRNDVHTIVETCGYGSERDILSLVDVTDVFYFDYKLGDHAAHRKYVGGSLDTVLRNLRALRSRTDRIVLRIPLIPGITDSAENVSRGYALASQLHIHSVHLLPYNQSAEAKYSWIGRDYALQGLEPRDRIFDELLSLAPEGILVERAT
jgi:glycyl-radical enzyme activating protein